MSNQNVSRRSISKGAAWGVPAVVVANAAPAMAASPVPTVKGASWYYDFFTDKTLSADTVRAEVSSGQTPGCSYTVTNGPATVSSLSMTYWLPVSNFTFSPTAATQWSNLTRNTSQANITSPNGVVYYAYTTTFNGTGLSTTTCGPSYSFAAPEVTTTRTASYFHGAYYYQFSYVLNGTLKTNPLQSINNP